MPGGDFPKVAVSPVRRPSSIRAQLITAAAGPDHGDKMPHKSLPHNHHLPRSVVS